MADRMEFTEKLRGVLSLAESREKSITLEEVEQYFEEDALSGEQMNLVCEYLLSQQVAVAGYARQGGVIKEKEEIPLGREEETYLEEYRRELAAMKEGSEEEAQMAHYLSMVAEEAVKLHTPEVFLGDLIQDGSVSLMIALNERPQKDEEQIMEAVRAEMRASAEAQTETKKQDKRMVEKVSNLDEMLKDMNEELGRKVGIDEVADRLGMTENEITDILKLAGEYEDEESD